MRIELNNVTKIINKKTVLNDISYTFESGKIYGLCGHNGSGKTMLLRAMAGFIKINDGMIIINNKILHKDISFPPNTGVVIEHMEMLPEYSARKNLQMLSKIRNIATEDDIKNALERVGLDYQSSQKVKKYSLGMKQRLNIAQAIFEKQELLLLDEPTNALDVDGVTLIHQIITDEKKRGATTIMATHHKEDLEAVCDVILRLSEGKIVEVMEK